MPTAVFGHSVGEVAAAWAAGALSLEDAVKVIYFPQFLSRKNPWQGRNERRRHECRRHSAMACQARSSRVCLAGINSPKGITLAGNRDQLAELEAALSEQGTFAKRLPLDYAFHSPAMDSIQQGVIDALADITPCKTQLPYYSTVTGELSWALSSTPRIGGKTSANRSCLITQPPH